MGQKKIAKKITPKNKQRIQQPRAVKTQQNQNPKKTVEPQKIVEKDKPEEPPRKTRARDRPIRPPSVEWVLKPVADLDSVDPETDQSSQESEESVNKPKYSIADCAAKLAELPGITIGDPLFVFAVDHFRINHDRRQIFMSMANDQRSLLYLNYVWKTYGPQEKTLAQCQAGFTQ